MSTAWLPAQPPGPPLPEHAVARLGTTRFRHAGGTTMVAFADGGKLLVTAGQDRVIRVWDVQSGAERRVLEPAKPQPKLDPFVPLEYATFHVHVSADGSRAVAWGYRDRKLRLWDIVNGKLLAERPVGFRDTVGMAEFDQAALSPDGKMLAVCSREPNNKSMLRLLDPETGRPIHAGTTADGGQTSTIVFSPDGKTIAWTGFGNSGKCLVRFIDAGTGKERARTEMDEADSAEVAAFTRDSRTFALGSSTGVRLVNVADGKSVRQLVQRLDVFALAVHPDGKQMVVMPRGKPLAVIDLGSGKITRRIGGRRPAYTSNEGFGSSLLAISPDGKFVATAGDDAAVRLYDFASGKEVFPAAEHTAAIEVLRFAQDGKTLFSAAPDGRFHTWEASTWKQQAMATARIRMGEGHAVAVAPDNNTVAITRNNDIELWNLAANKRTHVLQQQVEKGFAALAFTLDGNRLVVFELADSPRARLIDVATRKEIRSIVIDGAQGFLGTIGFGMFTPCNRWLLMPSADVNLALVDLETGKTWRETSIPEEFYPFDACFSPDGRTLLLQFGEDKLALIEVATGQERRFLGKKEPTTDADADEFELMDNAIDDWDGTPSVAISPDFRLAAQTRLDGSIGVWDIAAGKRIALLQGHRGPVRCLAFSPDGKRLASGSLDTTILVWDVTKFAGNIAAAQPLPAADFQAQWQVLLGSDAPTAFLAVERLAQPAALPWLAKELLKPPPTLDQAKIGQWLEDLDSPRYALREKATTELARLGDDVVPHLHRALAARPSAEATRRLRELLDKAGPLNLRGEKLRHWRALEVLERIRTPEARDLLRKLAAGPPERLLTREAQIALKRE